MDQPMTTHATHPVQCEPRDVRPSLTVLGAVVTAAALGWALYSIGNSFMGLLLAYSA